MRHGPPIDHVVNHYIIKEINNSVNRFDQSSNYIDPRVQTDGLIDIRIKLRERKIKLIGTHTGLIFYNQSITCTAVHTGQRTNHLYTKGKCIQNN